jgi:hypothetical protein
MEDLGRSLLSKWRRNKEILARYRCKILWTDRGRV